MGERERSVPNNLAVDSAGDTVLQLEVHLGNGVVSEDRGVRDITCTSKKNTGQFWMLISGCRPPPMYGCVRRQQLESFLLFLLFHFKLLHL